MLIDEADGIHAVLRVQQRLAASCTLHDGVAVTVRVGAVGVRAVRVATVRVSTVRVPTVGVAPRAPVGLCAGLGLGADLGSGTTSGGSLSSRSVGLGLNRRGNGTGGKGKDSEKLGGNHLEVKGGEVIRLGVGDWKYNK